MTMSMPPRHRDEADEVFAEAEAAPPPFEEPPLSAPAFEPAAPAFEPQDAAPAPAPEPSPVRARATAAQMRDRDARQRLRGLIRDIRAHAQAILEALPPVRTALALTDTSARDHELKDSLLELGHVKRDRVLAIERCRAAARTLLDTVPSVYDANGDTVTNLETAWDRALRALDRMTANDPAIVRTRLDELDAAIAAMMWQAALITMPPRVNEHLATLDVGGQLDFGESFADELPTAPARRRFLEILQSHPGSVTGEVDAERGIIYKAAHGGRRFFSYVLLFALIGPGAWLFINLATVGSRELGIPANWLFTGPSRQAELWSAYVFVVFGVVFHLLVEAVKQGQRSTDRAFLALGHWLTWIHVRETALAITILTMWAIPIGLALTLTGKSIDVTTALFAGYSIDSIIGVFLTRFDGAAKSSTESLLARLRPAAPTTSGTAAAPTG
jgi:hypothetical protein